MVTTTIDLSVFVNDDNLTIVYYTDDPDCAYEGFLGSYLNSSFATAKCPVCVLSSALAYSHLGKYDASRIFIRPVHRPSFRNGDAYGHFE
jgi:hypothetical protein